ncbi:hypothetical protein [Ectothiorhodospira variabilis]|uniref:capsular polysaccharide export protein, LipB/KpsS family n=1 Tax=Ectothiorhodospira variabilis TaxID=505694 RepID=UPI001EFB5978|nr:hypothetical protein [Ectothiorhodospira variabilis]MCG5497800.1 hypothetical protein [Ectothiorhodospira variabilis]
MLHNAVWFGGLFPLLLPRVARADVFVLPNDVAFPYNRICSLLLALGRPVLVMQEGIRFPLPAKERATYGLSGAHLAVWGKGSALHFLRVGVQRERVHVTGTPRFLALDIEKNRDEGSAWLASQGLDGPLILYLSNPIDAQAFCTSVEKEALFERFLAGIHSTFERVPKMRIAVRTHPAENLAPFKDAVRSHGLHDRILFPPRIPLSTLFGAAQAAIILASTVGLEALRSNLPLGVLEIPGYGFAHDYVSAGAAVPLSANEDLSSGLDELLDMPEEEAKARAGAYVGHHLELGDSTDLITNLIVHACKQGKFPSATDSKA